MNDSTEISPVRGPELALAPVAPPDPGFQPFGGDGFTFYDFLDIINPLQHIPLISNIYREMTGDTLDAAPRVLGGTLFGGPIGAVASIISVIVEEGTGKDPGDHLLALLDDEGAGVTEDADEGEEVAELVTAAGQETVPDDPIVETTLAEINVLRIEAGLPPVPVNAPPVELAAKTPVHPAPLPSKPPRAKRIRTAGDPRRPPLLRKDSFPGSPVRRTSRRARGPRPGGRRPPGARYKAPPWRLPAVGSPTSC